MASRGICYTFVALLALAATSRAADITVAWKSPLTAAKINAKCGDRLIFTFTRGASSVGQIKAASCSAAVVKNWGTAAPVIVPVTTGLTYFKSAVGSQCASGNLLLMVNTTCPPSPSPSPKPSPAAKTIVVTNANGAAVWSMGSSYPAIQAKCGDTLKFTWTSGFHDVSLMASQNAYSQCDFSGSKALSPMTSNSVTTVVLNAAGTTYYGCSVGSHCRYNQKVTVTTTC